MKILLLSFLLCSGSIAMAQPQVVTTGNNVIDATNPYGADVVIGSDAAGGIRHDSSIMWWTNSSASRISSTGHSFNFSTWATPQTPNASISSEIGGTSYLMGNVGIGTSTPGDRLVVNGNIRAILDQANFPGKNVAGIVAIGYSGITGAQNWALRGVYQHGFGVGNNADGGDLDVIKSLNGSTILATKTDGTPLGNVGIGTVEPTAVLDVYGTAKFGGNIANLDAAGNPAAYQNLAGSGKMLVGHNRSGGGGETDFIVNEGNGATGGFAFYSYNNASQEKQLLRVLGNGDVGIGTSIPREKLSVNGNIRAREVKVEANNWPDYVFEEGYKVKKLEELQSYIKENKHLPGMPTAKEVETNGVALGDVVKKLLKNQEELTLHLLAQQKKITELEKQLANQIKLKNKPKTR